MQGEEHPARLLLRDARERVLEGLSTAFAHDELSLEQFERRVDAAFAAESVSELLELLSDLGPSARSVANAGIISTRAVRVEVEGVDPAPSTGRAMVVERKVGAWSTQRTVAIFGNVERRGRLDCAPRSQILSVFGNVEIDLRDALLSSPVTEIEVRALFGNVEITVGPKTLLVCEGIGVFGSFSNLHRIPQDAEHLTPILRVTGSAVFGNVEIRTVPLGLNRAANKRLLG